MAELKQALNLLNNYLSKHSDKMHPVRKYYLVTAIEYIERIIK